MMWKLATAQDIDTTDSMAAYMKAIGTVDK